MSREIGRQRETDYESMTREQLVQRLLMIRAQWRDRAARKRIRDRLRRDNAAPCRPISRTST